MKIQAWEQARSVSHGKENIEISSVVSEQFELLGSLTFPMSNGSITVGDDGIGIEYSHNINEYSSVAASISGVPGVSLSVDYTVTTTDKYSNSVSTSLGMTYLNDSDNKNFVKVPVLEKATSQEFDWEAIKKGAYVTIAGIAGVVVIGWALVNNGSGVGVIDDAILLPIGTKLLTMGK